MDLLILRHACRHYIMKTRLAGSLATDNYKIIWTLWVAMPHQTGRFPLRV